MQLRSETRHFDFLRNIILENNTPSCTKNEKIKRCVKMFQYLTTHIDWVKKYPKLYEMCRVKLIEFYFTDVQFYCFFETFEINLNKLFNFIENNHSLETDDDDPEYETDDDDTDDPEGPEYE
jgi:hypothetical protein